MKLLNLRDFPRGWVIGNFEPSIIKTKNFEFCVKHYDAGQKDAKHVHHLAEEITVVVSGVFKINGNLIKKDDVVYLDKGSSSEFECIEVGSIACVKMPSVVGDKHLITKT